jgi:hypothetical protein
MAKYENYLHLGELKELVITFNSIIGSIESDIYQFFEGAFSFKGTIVRRADLKKLEPVLTVIETIGPLAR